MLKWNWREFFSLVGAALIVVIIVTWSALSNIYDVSRPLMPSLPQPEWFQVAIGLSGLVGLWWTVIFARRAWMESKRSADEAKRSADAAHEALADTRKDAAEQAYRFAKQLAAAESASKAAWETAQNARFIGQNQSRAYVHVSKAWINYSNQSVVGVLSDSGEYFASLHLEIENVGSTPTKSVRFCFKMNVEQLGLLHQLLEAEPDANALFHGASNVAPNTRNKVEAAPDVTSVIESGVYHLPPTGTGMFGQTRRYAWLTVRGRLVYKDVFDAEYYSDFAFYCSKPEKGRTKDLIPLTHNVAMYEKHPPASVVTRTRSVID